MLRSTSWPTWIVLAATALGATALVPAPPVRALAMPTTQGPIPLPPNALDGGTDWINTRGPIHLSDLKGKVVLLDFWTYCCINCHHLLPELAKLEAKYPDELVVIGVHTGKFDAEKITENIRKKVAEYGIKHPVVNDAEQRIWNNFGVNSWPTLMLIDPLNRFVGRHAGEIRFEELEPVVARVIAEHRKQGTLNSTPLRFEPEDEKAHHSPLRYPGKVLADAAGRRLFITDTSHHRIVITDLDGKHRATIGNGLPGLKDGPFPQAQFHRPQGTCLVGETLYVADTENHAIRAIDLTAKTVATVAGTGVQAPFRASGGPARTSPLSSPWDLVLDPTNPDVLIIAMAGPHQIWKLDRKAQRTFVFAGNGREDIRDGAVQSASFAQPSGLAADGKNLFVADSEGSCIRAISLAAPHRVTTIVGEHDLPMGQSLFSFDDQDGVGRQARLQHCLGVAFAGEALFIADTYNNKIKVHDPRSKQTRTFAGDRKAGFSDEAALFDEPGGLSAAGSNLYVADTNNHAIRVIDLNTRKVRTLELDGVTAPTPPKRPPTFPNATVAQLPEVKIRPGNNFTLDVTLNLPDGYKVNPDVPLEYLLETPGRADALAAAVSPTGDKVEPPAAAFPVLVPLARTAAAGDKLHLKLSVKSFLCQTTLCEVHSYVWEIPVAFDTDGPDTIKLTNTAR